MHSDTVPWQWQCHLHIQITLSGSLSLPFDLNVSVLWKLAFTNRSRLFCIQNILWFMAFRIHRVLACDLWMDNGINGDRCNGIIKRDKKVRTCIKCARYLTILCTASEWMRIAEMINIMNSSPVYLPIAEWIHTSRSAIPNAQQFICWPFWSACILKRNDLPFQ